MTASTETGARSERERGAARAPDFFIVGHHKSGTTALYAMLRSHPEIYMPALKEPRYFAPDLRDLLGDTASLPRTWDEYLALYARAAPGQLTGDASPSYLRSGVAARLIAEARPDARIIAVLREPASFLRSLHLHLLKEGVESETDFAKALAAERITRAGRTVLRYSDHVHYVEQLRRYHAAFAPEQVLVLIYDDFRRDNAGTLRAVLRFLDVDDSVALAPVQANTTVRVRSARLRRASNGLSGDGGHVARALAGAARTLIPAGRARRTLRSLRDRVVFAPPPPADDAVMTQLRRRYKHEVAELGVYLGRDLSALWGYDGLE
jgi:Sulfotransferase family